MIKQIKNEIELLNVAINETKENSLIDDINVIVDLQFSDLGMLHDRVLKMSNDHFLKWYELCYMNGDQRLSGHAKKIAEMLDRFMSEDVISEDAILEDVISENVSMVRV